MPVAVLAATAMVIVEVPAPVIDVGLKLTVTPEGWPLAVKAIAELNPPVTALVMVEVPELPCTTDTEPGDALSVKLAAALTLRETEVVCVRLPEVPVTVRGYVPAATEDPTVIVMVDVPAPVMEDGLNPTVTPLGCPLAVSVMAELNPPVTALVMVEVPELPCTTVTDDGEAESVKPAVGAPARALIRAGPFGLPHPVARSYPAVAEKPLLPLVMSWKSVV